MNGKEECSFPRFHLSYAVAAVLALCHIMNIQEKQILFCTTHTHNIVLHCLRVHERVCVCVSFESREHTEMAGMNGRATATATEEITWESCYHLREQQVTQYSCFVVVIVRVWVSVCVCVAVGAKSKRWKLFFVSPEIQVVVVVAWRMCVCALLRISFYESKTNCILLFVQTPRCKRLADSARRFKHLSHSHTPAIHIPYPLANGFCFRLHFDELFRALVSRTYVTCAVCPMSLSIRSVNAWAGRQLVYCGGEWNLQLFLCPYCIPIEPIGHCRWGTVSNINAQESFHLATTH